VDQYAHPYRTGLLVDIIGKRVIENGGKPFLGGVAGSE